MLKREDTVLREFANIGKYRVRLLDTSKGQVLDVREFVQNAEFEGYTRRGIRLTVPQDTSMLSTALSELNPAPQAKPEKPATKGGGKR